MLLGHVQGVLCIFDGERDAEAGAGVDGWGVGAGC